MAVTRVELIDLGPRSLRIHLPGRSFETILEEAPIDQFPWWAVVWPSAIGLGRFLLERAPLEGRGLEIGCGLGVAGLAGAAAGLSMTLTDVEREALDLSRASARDNRITVDGGFRILDWSYPSGAPRYQVLLGADVLYDPDDHLALISLLRRTLAPSGRAWLSDPGRVELDDFTAVAAPHLRMERVSTQTVTYDGNTNDVAIYELTLRA